VVFWSEGNEKQTKAFCLLTLAKTKQDISLQKSLLPCLPGQMVESL
jgi:hypothetical protein